MQDSSLNLFDGIVFINLNIREDRKEEIEQQLNQVNVQKAHRIEAYYDELNGTRGCVYSHIKALDFALDQGYKNVLVLEDDCIFIKNQNEINSYINTFFEHFQDNWDVFFLGTKILFSEKSTHSDFLRVTGSLRAHAYAVNRNYLLKLRNHFVDTYEDLRKDLFFIFSHSKALDKKWHELQKMDRWFVGRDMIAQQRTSFSDIEKGIKQQR